MTILFLPFLINKIVVKYISTMHNILTFILYTWSIISILRILYNYIIYFFQYIYLSIIDLLKNFEVFFKKYFYIKVFNYLLNTYNKIFIITILTLVSYIVMYLYYINNILNINQKFFIRIHLYNFFILCLNIYSIYNQFFI